MVRTVQLTRLCWEHLCCRKSGHWSTRNSVRYLKWKGLSCPAEGAAVRGEMLARQREGAGGLPMVRAVLSGAAERMALAGLLRKVSWELNMLIIENLC